MRAPRWNPLREPLLHFALGALALLGLERLASRRPSPARPRVVVSQTALASLRASFEAQSRRPATPAEERSLVDEYVRDEALAREAAALHLDVGDPVIRRRLVQKMQLVLDAQSVSEPTDDDLSRWLDAHRDSLRRAPSVTFEHVLFSRDLRGDGARRDALAALASMTPDEPFDRASARGDPSLRGNAVTAMGFADVTSAFGYAFATALDPLPAGRWQGPLEGTHGWHLVKVTARDPGGPPPLAAVRNEVRRRWTEERRAALVREATRRIVDRYEVVR